MTSTSRRGLAAGLALALVGGLAAPVAVAAEPTTQGDRAADGLLSLARTLDALGGEPMLGTPLPMTLHSPASLLGFPTVFGQGMADLASGSFSTVQDVATALDGTDLFDGTTVVADGTAWRFTIPVALTETQAVPIVHFEEIDETSASTVAPDDAVSLVGGPVEGVTATLTGELVVVFDPDAALSDGTTFDPQNAVSLAQTSSLSVSVTADDEVAFSSVFGLTEVDVTGDVDVALTTPVAFTDPDGSGAISRAEWETTLLTDLTVVSDDDPTVDDVTVALELDSDLIDGTTDGTWGYAGGVAGWVPQDGSFEPVYVPDVGTGDHLGDFLNVTVEDALASLAQYATAAQAIQSQVDVPMPFTSYRLQDAYSPADRIMEVLERQAAAAVVCGKVPTSPPSGADLPGTSWYCQGFSTQDPSEVQWRLADGSGYVIDGDGDDLATVGVSPTALVRIDVDPLDGGDGTVPPSVSVDLEVSNEDGDGSVGLTADRRFRTAQELLTALGTVGTADLGYDGTHQTLTWDLALSNDPATPESPNAAFDIGDMLRTPTHLSGVEAPADGNGAPAPAVEIDVDDIAYQAGFGVMMHDPVADEVRGQRYFFQDSAEGAVLSVGDVSGTMTGSQTLLGKIGFVDVDVTPDDTAFAIGKSDETGDAMAVDVDTTTSELAFDDAILFDDLLTDPASVTDATFNLSGDLHLDVAPSGDLDLGIDGEDLSVTVAWDDYPETGADVAMSDPYELFLFPLDIVPILEGVYVGGEDGTQVGTALDLTSAFGDPYAVGDVVETTLFNVTSGATCARVRIVDADTFECAEAGSGAAGLHGSQRFPSEAETAEPDNHWQPGDRWMIQGDPDALRGVILDALYDVADRLELRERTTTPVYSFPLVGLAPRDLDPRFADVAQAINELRALPDDPAAPLDDPETPEDESDVELIGAPDSLQELETALAAALDAISEHDDAATVAFELDETFGNPADGGYEAATHLTAGISVSTTDATTEAPIRIDLGTSSDLGRAAGMKLLRDADDVTANETLEVTYSKTVSIDVAIPIATDVPLANVVALETSGVSSMSLSAGSDEVSFAGTLGPLEVIAGTGATMTGTHAVPSGTHTATSPLASGAHTATGTGDPKDSSLPLAEGDVIRRDGDSLTCTVQADGTCPLGGDATWAEADAWTATEMATLTPSPDLTGIDEGDVLLRGDDACRIGSDVAICDPGTPWAHDDTWTILEGTVLTDDAADLAFDELRADLPVPLTPPTITVNRIVDDAAASSCDATALDATTIRCDGLETSGGAPDGWNSGDAYELIVGDATTTMLDPGADFHKLGLVGATVTNETDGSSCTVASAGAHLLICASALEDGQDNRWEAGDTYVVSGIGEARIGVDRYELLGSPAALIPAYVDSVEVTVEGSDGASCGTRTDDACATLSLMVPGDPTAEPPVPDRYLGQLSWQADLTSGVSDTGGAATIISPQVEEALDGEEPLRFTLLSAAFDALKGVVAQALEGTLINEPLPLIGLDVSAGSRLLEAIELAEQEVASQVPGELNTETDLAEIESELEGWLQAALDDVADPGDAENVLLDVVQAVDVVLHCGEDVCSTSQTAFDVDDVEVSFVLGGRLAEGETSPGDDCENCLVEGVSLDYDAGLDGLPLDVQAELEARVGWSLPVTVGVSRDDGPYLDVTGDDLELDALVRFPDPGEDDPACPALPLVIAGQANVGGNGFSSTRCAVANIGLFQGTVWDGYGPEGAEDATTWSAETSPADGADSDRSRLVLQTTLDLSQAAEGGQERISAASVLAGEVPTVAFTLDADANVDLYFRTGVQLSDTIDSEGLPSVQGAFHLSYALNGEAMLSIDSESTGYLGTEGEEIRVDRLILDAGSFFKEFVSPIAGQISTYTKPFKPIIDVLNTPIPVISDVSRWTGNGVVRPIDVLREAVGADKLQLLERVLDIIVFAEQVTSLTEQGYISLGPDDDPSNDPTVPGLGITVPNDTGKFAVGAKGKRQGDCGGKNPDGSLKSKNCKTTYNKKGTKQTTTVKQLSECGGSNKPCTGKEMTRTVSTRINKPRVIPGGLTFPFMDDATQVFGMIMGTDDATLVRFDAGTLVASAGLSVSFGPFMAGPVPIDITVGANFSIQGRFAMGYDTRGITNLLKQDPQDFDPSVLLEGIFIDDLDAAGLDVPEITVAVTATLAASVSVKIFKVGLEGGVTLAIEFNLNDPDRDGKLRLAEIRTLGARNPMCLFQVKGTLAFFLGFFVEVDIKIKTLRWSKTLFSAGPFTLFEVECEPEPPALATENVSDSVGGAAGDLRLNIGEGNVGHRNYAEDESKEKYLVRQLSAEGAVDGKTRVSVEGFGLYQEFLVGPGGHIWGEAGTNHDTLRFEPGSTGKDEDEDGEIDVIPFTLDVRVDGGDGNDKITTGGGDDRVTGAGDNDTIQVGLGDDVVDGGAGNDNIAGGPGDDALDGGGDDDIVSGEQGSDVVAGGGGNDDLGGGPGLDAERFDALVDLDRATEADRARMTDGDDVLWGGEGDDRLRGHVGDDVLFGDELLGFASTPTTAEALRDARDAGLTGFTSAPSDVTGFPYTADGPEATPSDACSAAGAETGGADALSGEAGDDLVFGGAGDDDVSGGLDDDLVCGNGGRDLVDGDAATGATGDDAVDGGPGDDRTYGRGGHDQVRGGPGDDLVDGDEGNDRLLGGTGTDALSGGPGNDVVMGDGGTITVTVDGSFAGGPSAYAGGGIEPGGVAGAAGGTPVEPMACDDRVRIRGKKVDLDGDGVIGSGDAGWFAGYRVIAGELDVDGDGGIDGEDAGVLSGVGILNGQLDIVDTILPGPVTGTGGGDADCVLGGAGDDVLFGNAGDDVVLAGVGRDLVGGNAGSDWLRGAQGDDAVHGGAGPDTILGDSGDDTLRGGMLDPTASGATDGNDTIDAGPGDDDVAGDGADDTIRGGPGEDALVGGSGRAGAPDGGDTIEGGTGEDLIAGDNAVVVYASSSSLLSGAGTGGRSAVGFTLLDIPRGGAGQVSGAGGNDTIDGGPGIDELHGQAFSDTIHGGRANDVISGGAGVDDLFGDSGNDRIVGGSSTSYDTAGTTVQDLSGVLDDGDTISGGDGDDVIAGDNARIAADRTVTFFDVFTDVSQVDAGLSGGDVIVGDTGDDVIRGQGGDDVIRGGQGSDDIEGNSDDDDLFGEQAADVLIGGSRQAGVLDGADDIDGGEDGDLILGDNADVTGTDTDVRLRAVVLHDVPSPGEGGGDTAGDDVIHGGDRGTSTGADAADRIYGQADDDTIHGQLGDDDLQGNAGRDTIYGEDGDDRIVGGSATDQSGEGGGDHRFENVADADDDLAGGTGTDRIVGDNAVIAADGTITFSDVPYLSGDLPADAVAGGDRIWGDRAPAGDLSTSGDDGPDVIRGQSGDDVIHGQGAIDDIEGNAGSDTIFGEDGDDDLVGGSREANVLDDGADGTDRGDAIAGGAGTDWIAGDNALLVRANDGSRTIELLDIPVAGSTTQPDERASGGDVIHGDLAPQNDGSTQAGAADVIHGQSGDDVIRGQQGDDTIDGNAGGDTIHGDEGDDALVGGSSAHDASGGIRATAGPGAGRQLLVGTDDAARDTISGGVGIDVILGDNGVIAGHGASATWRLHDVDVAGATPHAHIAVAGDDILSGDADTDVVLGQAGDDAISGGAADDSLHGGPGADLVTGDAGADDLVGGSSHHWVEADVVLLRTVVDGDDVLFGDAPDAGCLAGGVVELEDCTDTAVNTSAGADHGDALIGDNGLVRRDEDHADARVGRPVTDLNNGDPVRGVLLYDVDIAGQPAFHADASGQDLIFGAAGRDRIFGQADADRLFGNAGDDEVEGNGGDDLVHGSVGSDDLLGGSSSDVNGLVQAGAFPGVGSNVADGDDRIFGEDDHDVALGDNGMILRPVDAKWTFHLAPYGHVIRSTVAVASTAFELAGAYGDDIIDGGDGHDDLRGQLGNDELRGQDGDDTLLGDLGWLLELQVIQTGDPRTRPWTLPADALNEPVFGVGTLYRRVELNETRDRDPQVSTSQGTGVDRLYGGPGNDVMFGGSGADVLHGHGEIAGDGVQFEGADHQAVMDLDAACLTSWLACDQDDLFGGHGDDDVWGGPGHDRLFGGHNADDLDVIRADPATGLPFGNPDVDFVGIDLIFGGWGQDTMQADVSANGPDPGDRLIDSAGAYNAFFVCDGGYGDSTAMRRLDPAKISFLEQVAIAAGATDAATPGSSGWWELANIYNKDVKSNTNPVHPENPGNFVCNSRGS